MTQKRSWNGRQQCKMSILHKAMHRFMKSLSKSQFFFGGGASQGTLNCQNKLEKKDKAVDLTLSFFFPMSHFLISKFTTKLQ